MLSPADRRLQAAAKEAWDAAPRPSDALAVRAASAAPPIVWQRDHVAPPPERYTFRADYSDRSYQNFNAPQVFEGFGLDEVRATVA